MGKRGTELNPIRLKSMDSVARLNETDYIVMSAKKLKAIQMKEDFDCRESNMKEIQVNDPKVPTIAPDYRSLESLVFGKEDVATVIKGKRNIAGGVVLSDKEKLVMLAVNCLTPSMEREKIAEAMKIPFNEVRALRWQAERLMHAHFKVPTTQKEDEADLDKLLTLKDEDANHPVELAVGDEDVVLQVKVLRVLLGWQGGVAPQKRVTTPATSVPKVWKPLEATQEARIGPLPSDYRELHRLCYGTDPVDDVTFQKLKWYLGTCVKLSDKMLLVVLSKVALTRPMGMYAVGRAMGINKNHVLYLRRDALKIMQNAPPSALAEERIKKAKECRPESLAS